MLIAALSKSDTKVTGSLVSRLFFLIIISLYNAEKQS